MEKTIKISTFAAILLVFIINLSSISEAVVINSVNADALSPGQEGTIRIEIKNIFNEDVEDLFVILKFENLPFTPVGSSVQSVDEIQEDDEEDFVFRIRASTEIVPGDYEIPYTIRYKIKRDNEISQFSGTIGVRANSYPELIFTLETNNPIENQQGKINLKIINKGLADAKFVSVKVLSEDFTILSDNEVYVGTVDSDDFETASFDVLFKKRNSEFSGIVEYRDFENKKTIKEISLPVKVYSEQEALELGIIKPNNTIKYIIGAVIFIVLIIVYRTLRKRQRLKRSRAMQEE
ncbi:hypothetical protein HYV50_01840 [Candidatus Pacearchaeota archaeon]|nr:hypothetical protein [Candidatus Pacearchaeota archaeon]